MRRWLAKRQLAAANPACCRYASEGWWALHVLRSKATDFDPSRFVDHYAEAVVEMIKEKQAGMPVSREHTAPQPQNVVNLMDVLRRRSPGKKLYPHAEEAAPAA